MSEFGERLRSLREKRKLSADALGRAVGMREGAIYKLERGDSKEPEFTNGVRLARALNVSPEMLAGLDGETAMQPAAGLPTEPLAKALLEQSQILQKTIELLVTLATASGIPEAERAARDLRKQRDSL